LGVLAVHGLQVVATLLGSRVFDGILIHESELFRKAKRIPTGKSNLSGLSESTILHCYKVPGEKTLRDSFKLLQGSRAGRFRALR